MPTRGGLGTYAECIITSLANLQQDEIVAFVPEGRAEALATFHPSIQSSHLQVQSVDVGPSAPKYHRDFHVHWVQTILPAQLRDHDIDVFLGPAYVAPLEWKGPTVVTVHDLGFERHPEYWTPDGRAYYLKWAAQCAKRADAVISVSRFTADDIRELWSIRDDLIHVIYIAPVLEFVPNDPEESSFMVEQGLGISTPYILNVGGGHRRKNLGRLLDAYSYLELEIRQEIPLVLVNVDFDEVEDNLTGYDLSEYVRLTEYCPPSLMPHLYAAAKMLVYPSLYEGFGLPPLEAMICGTPVVAANTGSLPEILGDNAMLPDPKDVNAIRASMKTLLENDALRNELVHRGKEHARGFSWQETALQTRNVLELVTNGAGVRG
jgi:alpha-1,3-rhamnosyl/mannosyltransferase